MVSFLGSCTKEASLAWAAEFTKWASKTFTQVGFLCGTARARVGMASKVVHKRVSTLKLNSLSTYSKWIALAKPSLRSCLFLNVSVNTKNFFFNALNYLRHCPRAKECQILSEGADHILEALPLIRKLENRIKFSLKVSHPAPSSIKHLQEFPDLEIQTSSFGCPNPEIMDTVKNACFFKNLKGMDLSLEASKNDLVVLSCLKQLANLKFLALKISPINRCEWTFKDLIGFLTLPRDLRKLSLTFSRIKQDVEVDSFILSRYDKCLEGIKNIEEDCIYYEFLSLFECLQRLRILNLTFDYGEDASSLFYHVLGYAIAKRARFLRELSINIQTLMEDDTFCMFDINYLTQFVPKDIEKIQVEAPTIGSRKVPAIPVFNNIRSLNVTTTVRMSRPKEHQDGMMQLLKSLGSTSIQTLEFRGGVDVKSLDAIMNPWNFEKIEQATFVDIDDTHEAASPLSLVNSLVSKRYVNSFRLTFLKGNWDKEEFRKCVDSLISNNKLLHFSLCSPRLSVLRIYKDIIVREK